MNERREYNVDIVINGGVIRQVIIDSHYESKHPDINDALILEIVTSLDGKEFKPDGSDEEWEFYTLDKISHKGKRYRLVWCMKDKCMFIGVINCFRR